MHQARIFANADVSKRNTRKQCWITYNGNVYDVTEFLEDHPGGDDLILNVAGGDVGTIMADPTSHAHSTSAYEMLEEFKIGELGGDEKIVSEDWVPDVDFHPDETNVKSDYDKNKFLDLSRPLLMQVWGAPWSKEYYLSQVHNPRHLKESARLFGPDFLEMFTRTKWWVVPMVWGPITAFLFYLSALQFTNSAITAKDLLKLPLQMPLPTPSAMGLAKTIPCFLLGNVIWTLLEYGMHRFLFHIDDHLPDQNWAIVLHFLLHGIHHYLPMDRLRLVMPPLLFFVLETPFTKLAHLIFPKAIANGIIAGAFAFYILYDCCHYALHHTRLPQYLAELKRYHLAHHYKNYELGFGVTSKIWDVVFHTELFM
ncbi:oxidoreductase [Trichosporon asahii var. asahii CBS 8904]|uniref:Ceramide very long chain fatty acid hydroxylase n=2 Tax=Trichosporon asahii var. asahii TaxID=189963 RepID=K1VPP3_TRIAC|nr:oxidoreductase [Trichosporon asahii var. asahii CBS 2479]EJT47705.1 oxidoreductase [Trichosporon asahii var. asahii CBS 2479]EKD01442.1 oxidoreductase [Trichosporon asahii var. asahii CBS 8904]